MMEEKYTIAYWNYSTLPLLVNNVCVDEYGLLYIPFLDGDLYITNIE